MEDAAHVHALDLNNEIAGVHIVYMYIYIHALDLTNEISSVQGIGSGLGSGFRLKVLGDAAHVHALDLTNEISSVQGIGSGLRLRV